MCRRRLPPDDTVPSDDRRLARLQGAWHAPRDPSRYIRAAYQEAVLQVGRFVGNSRNCSGNTKGEPTQCQNI